jgi:polyisoprenoid-binding protein YceI
MLNKVLVAATVTLLSLPSVWAEQQLVAAKSEIKFLGKQMGVAQDGKFSKFSAKANLDPKKPDAGRAEITVELGSIDLGSAEANEEVIRPDWFDVAKFPQAKFVSSNIKNISGDKFEMRGKLTIKGTTKDVVVPFTLKEAGGMTTAQGAIEVKRLDFKVGAGVWGDLETVANEVQIKFLLTLSGAAAK